MKIKMVLDCTVLLLLVSGIGYAAYVNGPSDKRKTYVSGDVIPSMVDRKPELVPQAIPVRVRYVFAPNATVNTAAEILRKGIENADASLFADSIMLQPGGYKLFKGSCNLGESKIKTIDPTNITKSGIDGGLQMGFVRNKAQILAMSIQISKLLKEDGGFDVRALQSEEMGKWWIFIGFDIEEPVFVLASRNGKYKFVVELNLKNQIAIMDELNALPDRYRP
jgi:hypothetical protein